MSTCSKCENKSKAKNLCRYHYSVWYRENNRDKMRLHKKQYDLLHRQAINARTSERRKSCQRYTHDISYKLRKNLRIRLYLAVKNDQKAGSAIKDLGCTIEYLKQHLESLWQPGMSWDNWTKKGWHIDHIKPLASFDLSNRDELLKACHYTNLQPMWSKDNLSKGSKCQR